MTAESISGVVQQAVEWTGMEQVPVEDRTRLLTDRGLGFLARALEDYLRMLEIRHIFRSPYHPPPALSRRDQQCDAVRSLSWTGRNS